MSCVVTRERKMGADISCGEKLCRAAVQSIPRYEKDREEDERSEDQRGLKPA